MRKNLSIATLALLFSSNAFAAAENDVKPTEVSALEVSSEQKSEEIYVKVEKKAEFTGGKVALIDFLRKNVSYPVEAMSNGIQGTVIVAFIVNKDGSIGDVEVVRSIDPLLDAEAVRVVKAMPNWAPARNQDKPVRSKFRLPISFKLN